MSCIFKSCKFMAANLLCFRSGLVQIILMVCRPRIMEVLLMGMTHTAPALAPQLAPAGNSYVKFAWICTYKHTHSMCNMIVERLERPVKTSN